MTYYDVLGVTPSVTPDQIRRAHRELVKKYHPDRLRTASASQIDWAEKKFQEIQEAYEALSKHRSEYDRRLQAEAAASANPEPQASEKRARPGHAPSSSRGSASRSSIEQTDRGSFKGKRGLRPVEKVIIVGGCFFVVLLAASIRFMSRQNQGFEATPFPQYLRRPYPSVGLDRFYPGVGLDRFYPGVGLDRFYPGVGVDRFGGIMRNQTTNVSAQFAIALFWAEGSGSVSGCMAVRDPLSGSGALSGSYSDDAFVFTVKSSSGTMKFTGKSRDGELSGTYSANLKNGAKESGTFDVDRLHYGEDFISVQYYDCRTDAEVNDQ
jgi:curved DNA-binding protein CbpA